jgi:hypothetical protein
MEKANDAQLTSPTAKYLPSGLNDTHVAALTLSRAVQAFAPGESDHSVAVGEKGPAMESLATERDRNSEAPLVGVDGP